MSCSPSKRADLESLSSAIEKKIIMIVDERYTVQSINESHKLLQSCTAGQVYNSSHNKL